MIIIRLLWYSQTCVQRPPSGHKIVSDVDRWSLFGGHFCYKRSRTVIKIYALVIVCLLTVTVSISDVLVELWTCWLRQGRIILFIYLNRTCIEIFQYWTDSQNRTLGETGNWTRYTTSFFQSGFCSGGSFTSSFRPDFQNL